MGCYRASQLEFLCVYTYSLVLTSRKTNLGEKYLQLPKELNPEAWRSFTWLNSRLTIAGIDQFSNLLHCFNCLNKETNAYLHVAYYNYLPAYILFLSLDLDFWKLLYLSAREGLYYDSILPTKKILIKR